MAAVASVKNNLNGNQPLGTGGSVNNATMECPAGSYITQVSGYANDDVNNIANITCRNVVTGQTSGPIQTNRLGGSTGGNPVQISCNGTDGITGFAVYASGTNSSGAEVNGLKGLCSPFPGGAQYEQSQWAGKGKPDSYFGRFSCPSGYQAYKLYGAQSSGSKMSGYLDQFYWSCKQLGGAATIAGNNVARGKCIVGDDSSGDCAEIKGILSGQGSKESDVESYCAQGGNILLPNCSGWYNNDATNTNYQNILLGTSGYCKQGTNFTTNLCTSFCTATTGNTLPNGMKDTCNTLYMQKCAVPPANSFPICNSLQPWSSYPGAAQLNNIPGVIQDPECYFADVIAHGYKRAPTSTLGCPACVQNQNITIANSTDAAISNVVQSCSVSNGTSAPAASTPAPAASSTPLTSSLANSAAPVTTTAPTSAAAATKILGLSKSTFYIVLIIVIIVACCCSSSVGGGLVAVLS